MLIAATIAVVGLIGLLVFIVYLVDFSLASHYDNPRLPANSGSARRARRFTGMYVRGDETSQDTEAPLQENLRLPELAAH